MRDATASAEIVLDDGGPGVAFTGAWSSGNCSLITTCTGVTQRHTDIIDGTMSATWTPTLPVAGTWRISAMWSVAMSRAPDARYRIFHDGGTTIVTVDQRYGGFQLVPLGEFAMTPGPRGGVDVRCLRRGGRPRRTSTPSPRRNRKSAGVLFESEVRTARDPD